MLKTILAAVAATSLIASPALAQNNADFVGPRVELNAGLDDVHNANDIQGVNYGAALGYDVPLGDTFTLGGEATAQNVFDSEGREFGAGVRLGAAVTPDLLLFGRVGYSTVDLHHGYNADGLNVGAGLNFALTKNIYTGIEYRYSDFEHNAGRHGALVGVGLRF